jgi:hypothetical protein
MLAERLGEEWLARRASTAIEPMMRFAEDGLVLGAGTVLSRTDEPRAGIAIDAGDPRFLALLAAAHLRLPTAGSLAHIRKSAECWKRGEHALAAMHLALSGVDRLAQPERDAQRLFLAKALLDAGVEAFTLLKGLDLGPDAVEQLTKFDPNEPRVPAGSGRPSGQWTTGADAGTGSPVAPHPNRTARPPTARTPSVVSSPHRSAPAATSSGASQAAPTQALPIPAPFSPGPSLSPAAATVTIDGAGAGLDLGAMSEAALAGLVRFLGAAAVDSGALALGGVVAGFGLAFIPNPGPKGISVHVDGPGDISFYQGFGETYGKFTYTTADGVRHTLNLLPDPDGNYRGPDGRVIARGVLRAAGAGLLINTAALLGEEDNGPRLCPAPSPDRGGARGRAYEDFVKPLFNPGNPTPSGLAYDFTDPRTGNSAKIDDCQQRTGALAEYKGPGYAAHLLADDRIWGWMLPKLDKQVTTQSLARGSRPLIWFVDEKPLADFLGKRFHDEGLPISVYWLPMPRHSK